ncbi:TPA: hypothetical protein PIW00_003600 [Klebsiella quasipneumoniae subsp. similipneumoniae]|nr:hypothetical protein [Klebsiella quasipneumoniae subsp. similipneumoniae]
MRLKVNLDEGLAINMDTVAALLRQKNSSETFIVLVSGNQFKIDMPLSEVVEMVSAMGKPNDALKQRKKETQEVNEHATASDNKNESIPSEITPGTLSETGEIFLICRDLLEKIRGELVARGIKPTPGYIRWFFSVIEKTLPDDEFFS